jgi:DNA-binding HxlR family transcriptional regulator
LPLPFLAACSSSLNSCITLERQTLASAQSKKSLFLDYEFKEIGEHQKQMFLEKTVRILQPVLKKHMQHRSYCPVNLSLEVFGDKWSLLVIRDLFLPGKSSFRKLLCSEEKIATNILQDRLERLEREGIIIRVQDENHKQKSNIVLTKKGIDLLPVMVAITEWGLKYTPVDDEHRAFAKKTMPRTDEKMKKIRSSLMKQLKSI